MDEHRIDRTLLAPPSRLALFAVALTDRQANSLAVRRQRFRILIELIGIFVLGFTLTRLVLLAWFADWSSINGLVLQRVLFTGLRFDLLVALFLVQPQLWHLTWCPNRWLNSRVSRWYIELCWLLALLLVPLLAIIEFLFFNEFDGRLNYIAFEYLVYPTEVCCNIWQSYSVVPLIGFVLGCGGGSWWLLRKRFLPMLEHNLRWPNRIACFGSAWTVIAVLGLTLGMSSQIVSRDRVVNECAGNGLYTFLYHAWSCHFDYEQFDLTNPPAKAIQEIRGRIVRNIDELHLDSQNPFDRTVHQSQSQRDWNVVIVLEESLGSDFVGALGDTHRLTPCLDQLASQGILFDNFYATGNRTARALEAVTTSLPPIPTESILKRDHSRNVFTLAHVLAERGYNRLFMTAGRGIFDGVRSFMRSNGFNRFLEQKHFVDPTFVNAWGVSDEDLFHRALSEFDSLHAEGKPFFSILLTVSNHRPFTYPDGRIARPSSEQRRENAVQYADWALGQFFRKVPQHAWVKNTLFVVMGDHGARVYGRQMFPLKSYRVPVVILRPDDVGRGTRCSTLACSLDIAPTVMGLLGGDYRSVFFGRDALNIAPQDGYALMQHNHDVALLSADHDLIVLDSRRQAWSYRLNPRSCELERVGKLSPDRMHAAVAFFQTAHRLYYDERLFPTGTGVRLAAYSSGSISEPVQNAVAR